jgi:glycosyltransferase involved in cell wall biosynthesis/CheY-like chemotaxis protein
MIRHPAPLPTSVARPLCVCFVSHSGGDGGSERSMIELIDALTACGVQCRVLVPEEGHVTLALEDRGVPYLVDQYQWWARLRPLPTWKGILKNQLFQLLQSLRLARQILAWRCDVVVSNTMTIGVGALAARILGLPHITYAREFGDLDHGLHFELGARRSMRVLSMLSRCVVFNSAALAKHYSPQMPAARTRVIYNAVSVSAAAGRAGRSRLGGPFRCVIVGSVTPGKGHHDAIRATAELARRGLPVSLTIVGSGPPDYRRELEELIDSLGIGAQVEMIGHTPDTESFFRRADAALTCSRMEAFGRVTVEAMKLGTPVIGARSGGTAELIQDGVTGSLYTPGDAHDLADKIAQLERNPEAARLMAERARCFASKRFDLGRLGSEFLDLLREVAPARAHRWRMVIGRIGTQLAQRIAPAPSASPCCRRRVLLVDNNPSTIQPLADALEKDDCEVTVAINGCRAVELLEGTSYDLIISDLKMPELDGIGLYRWVMRERPRAAQRMLFITGNANVPAYREFLNDKRDRVFVKPIDLGDLIQNVRRRLGSARDSLDLPAAPG